MSVYEAYIEKAYYDFAFFNQYLGIIIYDNQVHGSTPVIALYHLLICQSQCTSTNKDHTSRRFVINYIAGYNSHKVCHL